MQLAVVNLGCKVNRVELDQLSLSLQAAGHVLVDEAQAVCVIINTCAVTAEAEKKTRKMIRRAHGQAQAPWVVVCGCSASLHPQELEALGERVKVCTNKLELSNFVTELLKAQFPEEELNKEGCQELADEPFYHDKGEDLAHRRLGIKVQDGCDNRCSYCIIWKARGQAYSLPVEEVLAQVVQACQLGVQELILTGINLGTYQADYENKSYDLAGLIELILDKTPIKRLRLSSVEPLDAHDRLLLCMKRNEKRICQHLHLALQSGCDKTLKEMERVYNTKEFEAIVKRAREISPKMSFSTDLIVGFPGESDRDFEESYEFCKRQKFSKIHTFRYSQRPGTPAAARTDQVSPQLSALRSQKIRELQDFMRREDALSRIGDREYILVEQGRQGTSGSYHQAELMGLNSVALQPGDLVEAQIEAVDTQGRLVARYLRHIHEWKDL